MEKITDLQLCGCVMLKYALETGQRELYASILVSLVSDLAMDYDLILKVMGDIRITENKSSFVFTGELDKHVWKILKKRGISLN